MRTIVLSLAALLLSGCGAIVEPGHRAVFFDAHNRGLRPEVLGPGHYVVGTHGRLEDFDVTYSTSKETLHVASSEGLAMDLHVAVIYRPIVAELYELDSEIGRNYYEEVIGPEFRSASRGVMAKHSYADLHSLNERIEDEIEVNLRRRVAGKHVEISSVIIDAFEYAPEVWSAHRARLLNDLESVRQIALLENESKKEKLIIKLRSEQDRQRIEADSEREELASTLRAKRAALAEQHLPPPPANAKPDVQLPAMRR